MTFMQFLCNFGITGIGPILPLYIKQMMGTDSELVATIVGFIIFISGGCSAAMSLNVGRITESIRPHRILVGATFFVGFTFIMQYMMSSVTGLGTWRGITGLGMGLIAPCTNTIIAKSVPPEKRSIVFGVVSSVFLMGNVAGPVCSGALARWLGYPSVFWSTAFAFLLAGALIAWNFRKEW
jgi:DHA1 family multidrug resistance protein-like MFS transporter